LQSFQLIKEEPSYSNRFPKKPKKNKSLRKSPSSPNVSENSDIGQMPSAVKNDGNRDAFISMRRTSSPNLELEESAAKNYSEERLEKKNL